MYKEVCALTVVMHKRLHYVHGCLCSNSSDVWLHYVHGCLCSNSSDTYSYVMYKEVCALTVVMYSGHTMHKEVCYNSICCFDFDSALVQGSDFKLK